jgi:hypothetical protein
MKRQTHDVEQRSPEWFELRRGRVTASIVGQLITTQSLSAVEFTCPSCDAVPGESCRHKRSGEPIATIHSERTAAARDDDSPPVLVLADNATVRQVAATLAAERIAGIDPDASYINRDMGRGIDSEPYARDAYAKHFGVTVDEVGFCTLEDDGYTLGFSPDGLVGTEGGIEVKSPRQKGHVLTVLEGEVPAAHIAQIQTGLLVTGRVWWDFVSFHGGMNLWVKRVHPDPAWFAAIIAAAKAIETTVEQMVSDYYTAIEGFPMTDPLPAWDEVELKL